MVGIVKVIEDSVWGNYGINDITFVLIDVCPAFLYAVVAAESDGSISSA